MGKEFRELKKDLRDLLSAFNAHNVQYLVVGGYAVGIYSEPRATKDFDVFIKSNRENAETIYRALAEYGARLGDLKPEDFDGHPTTVVQIGVPPLRIDILQRITGVEFEEAWNDRLDALMGSIPTHVISRDHLIRNKLGGR
jgi:hypothetical protein